ncbi:MAG: hydrogenase subunit MbhD domain-containing protein [Candidatus Fermentibacteria bacterium]|nr:hydrogenase subunit MbhD domain-containing protein [Candidatus Fermentibacteria bacterium]
MTLLAAASMGTGVMMLVAAVAALVVKKLISAIIIVGFVSLSASVLFLLMDAPDVAITEASIGAAISTVIFLWGRGKIGGEE